MSQRPNGGIWITRPIGVRPTQYVQAKGEQIHISFFPRSEADGWGVTLSRADARLLARRINQCLDETRKK